MPRRLIAIAIVATALYAVGVHAEDPDPGTKMFSFSGFGTLGVVHSSEDQADFTSTNFKPDGAGFSDDWSPDVDSRIAAQLTANFTSRLSAVVQVIVEQQYDDDFTPAVEWANIKYQITPDLSVRAGRIALPNFLVSDYRKVGYANPWVRPPIEVYGVLPITNNDGADVSYRMHVGEVTNTVQAAFGIDYDLKLPNGYIADASDLWGIFDSVEYGAASFHLSYMQVKFTLNPAIPLFDAFRQFGPQGIAIAEKYGFTDKSAKIMGFGASYDPGEWFATGEWTRRDIDSFLGVSTGWYVSGGYRVGKFTPYITYGKLDADVTSDPGLTASDFPPSLAATIAALNGGLNQILNSSPVQATLSVGGRWDFMKNFDLKLQYDHTNLGSGSAGTLINTQPGFQPGGNVDLVSAAVDFVF